MNTDETEGLLLAAKAADWIERLPTAGPQEQQAFRAWLEQSPRHVHEALLAMAWDDLLRDVDSRREIDIDELIRAASGNVIPLQPGHGIDRDQSDVSSRATESPRGPAVRKPPLLASLRGVHRWAIAAVIPVVVTVPIGYAIAMSRVVTTEPGELRTVSLSDGTEVRLGPLTRLHLDFTDQHRRVRLARGEAIFYVAKEKARLFLVETDLATARAVGTAFSVSHLSSSDRVLITVQEGEVAVSMTEDTRIGRDASVRAGPGQQVAVAKAMPMEIRTVDLEVALAWMEGKIVLNDATFNDAVREINRRSRTTFWIGHPSVATRRIVGVFKATDIDSFVEVVRRDRKISVVRVGHDTFLLLPRPAASRSPMIEQQAL